MPNEQGGGLATPLHLCPLMGKRTPFRALHLLIDMGRLTL